MGEFLRCRAPLVIVSDVIDPSGHGIASHQLGIVGFQQVGRRSHILHSRIEPQVVTVWIEPAHPVTVIGDERQSTGN